MDIRNIQVLEIIKKAKRFIEMHSKKVETNSQSLYPFFNSLDFLLYKFCKNYKNMVDNLD